MAYIGKFRDGWRVQIQKDGVRRSKTFPTKRECQAWATAEESKKTFLKKLSLRDACSKYLKTVTPDKRKAGRWEELRFEAFCAYFDSRGIKSLEEITSAIMGEWRDWRLETVSGSTVIREVNLYRNLFKIAATEWKAIDASPFQGVRLPKENASRVTVWRWPEIKRVIRAGQARGGKTKEVTQAFHIALRTAMRLQEALAAPKGFDKVRRVVTIPPSKENPLPQTVPITRQGWRLMQTMPPLKVEPNEASVLFSDLCKQLLIEGLQFRDSRATALTLMARKMDILTLSKISRHKDIRMLQVYYRETAEEISARL
jgi:integrase